MKVSNWGNYPSIDATIDTVEDSKALQKLINANKNLISRGMGRCYGDSALNQFIASTLKLCRILSFDNQSGIVTCESGVTFEELIRAFVPQGWFPTVTPGTKFTTVGGAIACDIHGKNHHKEGSFSNHLISFDLILDDGHITTCTKKHNSELFWSTCGGMGLTGVILNATFSLKSIQTAYIRQEVIKAKNLDEILELCDQSADWTYTAAWIDCFPKRMNIGRGIFIRGEHASIEDLEKNKQIEPLLVKDKKKLKVHYYLPSSILTKQLVEIFNFLYYITHKKMSKTITNFDTFFYPLDFLHNWNKLYGRGGFIQYHFVLPKDTSKLGVKEILIKISDCEIGSFLGVLKFLGKQEGYMSFPMEGYSMALDFPIKNGLFEFLNKLDEVILALGGRLYLAKDARMSEEMFIKSYLQANRFINIVKKINKNYKFRSLQSVRLGITQ